MTDFYEALKRYDLRELLKQRGFRLNAGDFIIAPWRDERTPSVKIYTDHFYDYGDPDKHGNFLDWLEQVEGFSKEAARDEAVRLLGGRESYAGHLRAHPPINRETRPLRSPNLEKLPAFVEEAHEALVRGESQAARAALTYLESRGLSGCIRTHRLGIVDDTGKALKDTSFSTRLRERLIIPIVEQGRATWFKARDISGRTKDELKAAGVAKYDGPSGNVPAPFNADALQKAAELGFVVLTEGETDALSVVAAYGPDYPVLGLPGGHLPSGWDERLRQAGLNKAFVLMDSDDAGRGHAERLRAKLTALEIDVEVLTLPGGGDLNDLLVGLGPEGLIGTLETLMAGTPAPAISDLIYVRETWLDELNRRANRPYAAYSTGLAPLDDLLDGGYLEGLHLIGGITGGGKTSLALFVALFNALAGRPVLFASYEQSRLELWARIAARLTRLPYGNIKRGFREQDGIKTLISPQLRESEGWGQLEQAARCLKIVEAGDALSRTESVNTLDVLAKTAEQMTEASGAPPLVIMDYMQRIPAPAALGNRDTRERVGAVAAQLQVALGRGLGCPVLALSSIGRVAYRLAEADLEGRLAAFKEAGELEYTAYTALLIYDLPPALAASLHMSPRQLDRFRPMALDLCKNREGERGCVAVKWVSEHGDWRDAQAVPAEKQRAPQRAG